MKKVYTKALCIKNDQGFQRVLIIGKEYLIVSKTQRYITVMTEIGNLQGIWKGYFKLME